MSTYEHLDREQLIRLLQRRDAERSSGWCGSATKSKPTPH